MTHTQEEYSYTQKHTSIWIVFSGETEISWLRWLLKAGFRHCYALINDGDRWITVDPLAHKMEVVVHHHAPVDFDLPTWLEKRGVKVVKVHPREDILSPCPPSIFTCVEAVKRLVGLRNWGIFTPYQLYKKITS
tara:strand:- start:247 stop:648 length:402 start_codon:yes stop_codon:yes gene_type:complete